MLNPAWHCEQGRICSATGSFAGLRMALSCVFRPSAMRCGCPGPTTYTSTVHIPASRPLKIIKYTGGKPAYDETLRVSGTVNLHLG